VRRVFIVSYHEVEDEVAIELHQSYGEKGSVALAEFMLAHPPLSNTINSGVIRNSREE
jgi:hypothetical protein